MRTLFTSALTLVAVGLLAAACSDSGSPETPAPTATVPTLKIGAVLSLSGPAEALGKEAKNGMEVAIAQINSLGGIRGKKLEAVILNDLSDPVQTVAKVNELKAAGIVLGIGPSTSATAFAMKDLIARDEVLYISPSATSKVLDQVGDTKVVSTSVDSPPAAPIFFRTAATDVFLSAAISQYASTSEEGSTSRRCASIAILKQNDEYGTPIAQAVLDKYQNDYNLPVMTRQPFELSPNAEFADLSRVAETIGANVRSASNPQGIDCQVVIAEPTLAGRYMIAFAKYKQSRPALNNFITIGSDGFRQNEFIIAGRQNPADSTEQTGGEGAIAIAADTAPNLPEFNAFRNLFKARFPTEEPGRYGSTSYDATMLLALTIEKVGEGLTNKDYRDALWRISQGRGGTNVVKGTPNKLAAMLANLRSGATINYDGASGPVNFEIDGHVKSSFGVWKIQNASFLRLNVDFDVADLESL